MYYENFINLLAIHERNNIPQTQVEKTKEGTFVCNVWELTQNALQFRFEIEGQSKFEVLSEFNFLNDIAIEVATTKKLADKPYTITKEFIKDGKAVQQRYYGNQIVAYSVEGKLYSANEFHQN